MTPTYETVKGSWVALKSLKDIAVIGDRIKLCGVKEPCAVIVVSSEGIQIEGYPFVSWRRITRAVKLIPREKK